MFSISGASAQTGSTNSQGSNLKAVAVKGKNSMQEPDIWKVFFTRRSVRKFKPDSVPEAEIRQIIDAARMAPTSGNQQPWKFLVIRDRIKINQMMEGCIKEALNRYEVNAKETKDQFEDRVRKALS
jgi:nitroreductase